MEGRHLKSGTYYLMESKPAAAEKHGFDGQGWATAITIIIGQPGYNMAPTENWEVSSVLLSSSHILALHTQGGNLVKGKKAKSWTQHYYQMSCWISFGKHYQVCLQMFKTLCSYFLTFNSFILWN